MKKYLITVLILAGFPFASQFLINGDFEEPLTTGWLQAQVGYNCAINRATYYDPDPDYELYVHKGNYTGYTRVHQVVDNIPTTGPDLDFSVNAKLYASCNRIEVYSAAAVVISYLNESNSVLGETRIIRYTDGYPWTNSPTLHLIVAPDTNWNNYSFNFDDELVNLSGVNPLEISKIKVTLDATTLYC